METNYSTNNVLLIEYYHTRDRETRNQIIKQNQELVWFVVKKYSSSAATADDMFQAGILGLIKAVDKFNPDLGTKLSTYAIPHIQNEIRALVDNPEYINDCAGLTPVDEYEENKFQEKLDLVFHSVLSDIERDVIDMVLRTNNEPAWSINDIAKQLDISGKEVRDLYASGVHKMNEPWVRWYIRKIKEIF